MIDRLLRRLVLGVVTVVAVAALDAPGAIVRAGDAADIVTVDPGATVQSIKLGVNKSVFVDLPRDARDVLVSNPNVVDAVIRTPRRVYLTAIPADAAQSGAPTPGAGETNVIVFDRAGAPIVNLDVSIEQQDTNHIREVLARLIPGSAIEVEWAAGNIVISGTVKSDLDARKAQDIAQAFLGVRPPPGSQSQTSVGSATAGAVAAGAAPTGGGASNSQSQTTISVAGIPKVINLLTIQGEDQVHLKVTVAEVQRSVVKQLGVDLNGAVSVGNFKALIHTANPFAINQAPPNIGYAGNGDPTAGCFPSAVGSFAGSSNCSFNNGLFGMLRTLEETGMVRTLAEPTLTAISGESASFLAGGEFPVPSGKDQQGNVTISYKPFGVSLTFTPVVLAEGRISVHVKTEVSELSTQNQIQLSGVILPSIEVRRSESVMELPSGGAMVMGGLLQDDIRQTIAGLPGLQKLPVLGALFRSRDFKRNETELVIIVTPYLVKPVARTALARPDDGFNPASDGASDFLGRINRVYGVKGKPAPAGSYAGKYGFIFE
jgi:pilus assembly protein CpaC